MEEMLKKLLASDVLAEDTKVALEEGFKKIIAEAEKKAEDRVRAELSERFEKDKEAMAIALEQYLEQGLEREIREFREGMSQVDALKAQYAEAIAGLKGKAQKYIVTRLTAMEAKMDEVLRAEIAELHEDMKVNRKAYLQAIAEVKANAEAQEIAFKQKAAKVLENIIDVKLAKEISDLREDIQAAKKTHFEGQIFEAFSALFRRQFFDTNKEFKSLVAKLTEAETRVAQVEETAKKKIAEANTKLKQVSTEKAKLEESVVRQQKMSKLLGNLTGAPRTKMKALLEATSTANLESTYKKFVGDVLNESAAPTKQTRKIDEAVVELRTGTPKVLVETTEDDDEIVELMRRAGVRR